MEMVDPGSTSPMPVQHQWIHGDKQWQEGTILEYVYCRNSYECKTVLSDTLPEESTTIYSIPSNGPVVVE